MRKTCLYLSVTQPHGTFADCLQIRQESGKDHSSRTLINSIRTRMILISSEIIGLRRHLQLQNRFVPTERLYEGTKVFPQREKVTSNSVSRQGCEVSRNARRLYRHRKYRDTGIPRYFFTSSIVDIFWKKARIARVTKMARYTRCKLQQRRIYIFKQGCLSAEWH